MTKTLIPQQAQTDRLSFLNYLGTDSLRIYYQGELVFGQRPHQFVNNFSPESFPSLLESIEGDNQDWEIEKEGISLLDYQTKTSQLNLAVSLSRIEQGLINNEFSLGQALCGYWYISDISDISDQSSVYPFISALTTQMNTLLSQTNQLSSTILPTSSSPSLLTKKQTSQEDFMTSSSPALFTKKQTNQELKNTASSFPSLFTKKQTSQEVGENLISEEFYLTSPVKTSDNYERDYPINETQLSNSFPTEGAKNYNSFASTQAQQWFHHLFEQLHQNQRLKYQKGKAFFTLNGDTLVAQLNDQNQWEYVSGTLSQESLTKLNSVLNNSFDKSQSSSKHL